jgi:hypothetical protein
MKKIRVPGIVNMVEVSDATEIKALSANPSLDREFDLRTCPINWFLLKRSLSVLSFDGRRFPTVTRRDSEQRRTEQERLWTRLNEMSVLIRSGPETLEPLAGWVRGLGSPDDVGILAQQVLGRLFSPGFTASPESWAAAQVLVAAPRSWNPKVLWWFLSGKVRRSRRLLARMVDGDLSAVNAIGIAVHNLVKGIRRMRSLYADSSARSALAPDAAARECLFAPVSLYRQTSEAVQLGKLSFPRKSLFVFEVGEASRQAGGRPLVFMEDSWSRCPAAQWVPAMLEGLWRRATAPPEVADPGL